MHSVQNCNLKCKYIGMSENVMLTSHFADSDSDSAFLSCLWRILYKVQTAQAQYVAEWAAARHLSPYSRHCTVVRWRQWTNEWVNEWMNGWMDERSCPEPLNKKKFQPGEQTIHGPIHLHLPLSIHYNQTRTRAEINLPLTVHSSQFTVHSTPFLSLSEKKLSLPFSPSLVHSLSFSLFAVI